jgi:NADPH:quinone reductase-like Zn-dependent oxidoreductase
MKVWQVAREWSIEGMELAERPEPVPGPGQVAIRIRAASLNYRDLPTVEGRRGFQAAAHSVLGWRGRGDRCR